MAALQRVLAQPARMPSRGTDGRGALHLGLAVAGLAALALSGLIAAQEDPPVGAGSAAVSTAENGYGRWASLGPGWRSRSQILEDAGILNRPSRSP
jgi:hypothetical protein